MAGAPTVSLYVNELSGELGAGSTPVGSRPRWRKAHRKFLVRALREDPELQQKVNAIAYAHHLIFNGHAANFISTYLDDEFKAAWKMERRHDLWLFATLASFFCVITLLPLVYGSFLMKNPCVAHKVYIEQRVEHFAELGCNVERFMESPAALLLGPAALGVVAVLRVKFILLISIRLHIRRKLKRVRLFIYQWVRQDLWKLWYQPFNDNGANLALHFSIGLYFVILVEFVIVGAILRDGIAIFVGYASAKVLLIVSNTLLAPTDMRIEMVHAELRGYTEDGTPELGLMLDRLRVTHSSVFFVTSSELNNFYKIQRLHAPMREGRYYWYGDPKLDEQNNMSEMEVEDFETPIWRVYISDKNLAVAVQSPQAFAAESAEGSSDSESESDAGQGA